MPFQIVKTKRTVIIQKCDAETSKLVLAKDRLILFLPICSFHYVLSEILNLNLKFGLLYTTTVFDILVSLTVSDIGNQNGLRYSCYSFSIPIAVV